MARAATVECPTLPTGAHGGRRPTCCAHEFPDAEVGRAGNHRRGLEPARRHPEGRQVLGGVGSRASPSRTGRRAVRAASRSKRGPALYLALEDPPPPAATPAESSCCAAIAAPADLDIWTESDRLPDGSQLRSRAGWMTHPDCAPGRGRRLREDPSARRSAAVVLRRRLPRDTRAEAHRR